MIRVEYVTLCRSDLYTYTGKRQEPSPTILGHEIVGRIEEMAAGAPSVDARNETLSIGDRVTWAIFAADPLSEMALRGIPQKAPDLFKYGHEKIRDGEHLHGGMAQYCILRKNTPVIRLKDEIPLGVSALLNCSVATCAGALRVAGPIAGRRILIAGAGMLGLCAVAMCHAAGASFIEVLDPSEARKSTAQQFGASSTSDGLDADIAFDFSGVPDAIEGLYDRLAIGGTLVLVGTTTPTRPISIDPGKTLRRLLTLRGLHNYNTEDFVNAVTFMEQHHLTYPFASLVEHGGNLIDANAIMAHAASSSAYRVGISCD